MKSQIRLYDRALYLAYSHTTLFFLFFIETNSVASNSSSIGVIDIIN